MIPVHIRAASLKEPRVTQIIREVKLLPSEKDPRPAEVNDRVPEDTAVRTGDKSRSELTFADLTISRLGANTIYSYAQGGRNIDLGGGSILLRVPKDSGGGSVRSSAVSVAVTGTTLILESSRGGRNKLLVLEGSARLGLIKYPKQTRSVRAGQMLDVPAGATTLPMPVDIDLKRTMKEHPLIAGFPPLAEPGPDHGCRGESNLEPGRTNLSRTTSRRSARRRRAGISQCRIAPGIWRWRQAESPRQFRRWQA